MLTPLLHPFVAFRAAPSPLTPLADVLSGGYPAFDTWIPSHQVWALKGVPINTPDSTPFHSKVVGGSINQIVDRDLQTSLALDLANPPAWAPAPGWVTFDLEYSFTVSAFKVHTVWTNGPRRTTLEYSTSHAGPWLFAGTFVIRGNNQDDPVGDSHTRPDEKMATILTGFGRITAQFWRVLFHTRYTSLVGDRVWGNRLMILEVGFKGSEAEPVAYTHKGQSCAYPLLLVDRRCLRPDEIKTP